MGFKEMKYSQLQTFENVYLQNELQEDILLNCHFTID